MAAFTELLEYVHDELPAVPKLVGLRALCDAARTFCYFSTVWRETLPLISLRAGRDTYELPFEDATALVRVVTAKLNGRPIDVLTAERAEMFLSARLDAAYPIGVTLEKSSEVKVLPAPKEDMRNALELKVALQPTRGATELPDDIAMRYGEEIACGAKERLCRMVAQPWSSLDAAAIFQSTFRPAISRARRDVETSYNSAETRTHLRRWV